MSKIYRWEIITHTSIHGRGTKLTGTCKVPVDFEYNDIYNQILEMNRDINPRHIKYFQIEEEEDKIKY